MYELQQVQQTYNGRCVLDIDHLTVTRGEILALIGPSGAGKSTLLRLLDFLEPPSTGRITFDNQPVTPALSLAQQRRVTTVFQRPVLLRGSVAANLRYGLSLRGRKLAPAVERQWLERLGLAELAHQPGHTLSAGEAQRVALARALVVEPDVLLLDEPTANLDPHNVALIEQIIREENEQRGTTMVLVTHNIFQARRLAQRTALLYAGRLVETSDTATLFASPREAQTAAFLRGELIY
jgi:tungstate transport system ATP-binding protein